MLLALASIGCSGTTADHHKSEADNFRSQGRFEEALYEYGEAINLDPKLAVAYSGRAAAYNALGQYDLAIQGAD